MKFSEILRSSVRAIFKNKRRSIFTMIGIVIGIAAVITIIALGRGFQQEMIARMTNGTEGEVVMEINFIPYDYNMYNGDTELFTEEDLELVMSVEGVTDAAIPTYDLSEYPVNHYVNIKGVPVYKSVKLVPDEGTEVKWGRAINESDNLSHNKVAVIESNLAEELYGSPEAALGKSVDIDGQLFTIVGVTESKLPPGMYSPQPSIEVPANTYYDYFAMPDPVYALRFSIDPRYVPNEVAMEVMELLEESGTMSDFGEYQYYNTALLTEGFSTMVNSMTMFIASIAGISLLIAGVGVMNMMYISVSERTKEIGIRRALGASAGSIKMQFLLEGVILTLIGGILGFILGTIFASIVSSFLPFDAAVDFGTVVLAVGVSSAIGITFSYIPASKAAKKDLIDILK